ncbi:hypothetical protein F5877DRAFT_84775 [Lentinula edodes]|nr:hypothetical protein F5877DRAFT_84775 [Lentinula edodes]
MDRMNPEEFVDNIDGMEFAAFNDVTEEDLDITSDPLEVQSPDRTRWFPLREVSSPDKHIEIQTIHSHIQDVEPSSLISELSPESLNHLLPPGLRACQVRLEFLLQVIEVARLHNAESSSPNSVYEQPCVQSSALDPHLSGKSDEIIGRMLSI